MRTIACFAVALSMSLVPAIAKAGELKEPPDKTAPFASWSPTQQYMLEEGNRGDPRSDYGYGTLAGALLLADELGDKFSESGRITTVQKCFRNANPDTSATLQWALCGPDAKAVDLKKLDAELTADGVTGKAHDDILQRSKTDLDGILKIGVAIDTAAKTDPGLTKYLKITDDAKAEWAAYIGKNKDAVDRYLALKDAVRSGKSNNPGFAGCFEATGPAFTKLVKAVGPKIPWDVGNDQLPGYMKYLQATPEGYIATVAWAACAWSADPAGESVYAAAANADFGGKLRAGWRTLALSKYLDPELKVKFADRSLSPNNWTFEWKYGVKMTGINDIAAIQTPQMGAIAAIKTKGDSTSISFKGATVDGCLQWADTNKVQSVNNGNVQYERVCKKRGQVQNDLGTEDNIPTKYVSKGTHVGDSITIINKFPVVSWKGKKVTALLGVAL